MVPVPLKVPKHQYQLRVKGLRLECTHQVPMRWIQRPVPNFSLLTCSDLSSVALQHEYRFEGQSLEVTTASDHLSQHICLSPGYKIVMDNIDKNVRPREMRLDSQTESLHYMHLYSVRDRVNFSGLSNTPKNNDISIYDILPTAEDYAQLKHNLSILLVHTMKYYLSFFGEKFQGLVENHIYTPSILFCNVIKIRSGKHS